MVLLLARRRASVLFFNAFASGQFTYRHLAAKPFQDYADLLLSGELPSGAPEGPIVFHCNRLDTNAGKFAAGLQHLGED